MNRVEIFQLEGAYKDQAQKNDHFKANQDLKHITEGITQLSTEQQ